MKHPIKLLNASMKRLFVLAMAVLVAGCASNAKLNDVMGRDMALRPIPEAQRDDVGQAYIAFQATPQHPMSLWMNDELIGTQTKGYVRLMLLPGEYILKNQAEGYDAHSLEFTLKAGQTRYFKLGGTMGWVWSPYVEVDESEYREFHSDSYLESHRTKIKPSTPMHGFLPQPQRGQVKACLEKMDFETCNPVYESVPHTVIAPKERRQIVSLVEEKKQALAAEEKRRAMEASLPKPVLRDKYMIALRDALASQNYEKALPVFERLQALEMPLDPDFHYFYGEALHETGNQAEALQATSRYLRQQGNQAQFYQEALQLLNRIQEAM